MMKVRLRSLTISLRCSESKSEWKRNAKPLAILTQLGFTRFMATDYEFGENFAIHYREGGRKEGFEDG